MKQFKSAGQAQRFLSAHDQINNLFHLHCDHLTAAEHRASRTQKSKFGPKSAVWVGSRFSIDCRDANLADPMQQVDGARGLVLAGRWWHPPQA
jgi:putative transposase